jgi:hypothetical protein
MDAKSFIKIGLFGVGIITVDIGSAFGWKCSFGHEHEKNEMCEETGERYCGLCEGVHSGFEVCPRSIFRFPSEGFNYVILPSSVPDGAIVALQKEYGYSIDDERKDDIAFPLMDGKYEINRLGRCVEVLRKKFLTDKVEDKKEGNENRKSDAEDVWGFSDVYGSEKPVNRKMKLGKVLRKKRKSSEQKYWERVKDYELLKKLYLDESASEVKPRKTKKKKQ